MWQVEELAGGNGGNFKANTMIISLSTQTINDLIAFPAQIFSDLWVIIALGIGIPMAFYIIEKIIELFDFEANDDEDDDNNNSHQDSDGNVYGKLPKFVVDARERKGEL